MQSICYHFTKYHFIDTGFSIYLYFLTFVYVSSEHDLSTNQQLEQFKLRECIYIFLNWYFIFKSLQRNLHATLPHSQTPSLSLSLSLSLCRSAAQCATSCIFGPTSRCTCRHTPRSGRCARARLCARNVGAGWSRRRRSATTCASTRVKTPSAATSAAKPSPRLRDCTLTCSRTPGWRDSSARSDFHGFFLSLSTSLYAD